MKYKFSVTSEETQNLKRSLNHHGSLIANVKIVEQKICENKQLKELCSCDKQRLHRAKNSTKKNYKVNQI